MPVSLTSRPLRRLLIWGGASAAVLGLYAALGFFGLPHLLRSQGRQFVERKYGRVLQLGRIHFNPFTLELTILDFALPDADGSPMLAAQRLYVNLQLASLWNRGATFKDIQLTRPAVHARLRADGSLNLADLGKPFPGTPSRKPSPPARLFIGHLAIAQGEVTFVDLAHPRTLHAEIRPLNFELRDFNTIGTGGDGYTFAAATPAGEQFRWNGNIAVAPLASHGQFSVRALQVATLTGFAGDAVPLAASGTIALDGAYDFTTTAAGAPDLVVDVHTLAITDVGLRPRHGTADYVQLPRIQIDGTHVDLARRSVQVASVALTGGHIDAWRSAAGVNLAQLTGAAGSGGAAQGTPAAGQMHVPAGALAPAAVAPAPAASPSPSASVPAAAPWSVAVPQVTVEGLQIALQDRTVEPAADIELAPLSIAVTGFKWPAAGPLQVQAGTGINGSGRLDARLQAALTGAVTAHLQLQGFDLAALQPYVARFTGLTLQSGVLATQLDIQRGTNGALRVAGNVDVTKFRTIDDALRRDLVKWDRLSVKDLRYQTLPAKLSIRSIVARAPYARVIVAANRTLNIAEALKPAGTPVTAAPGSAAASTPGAADATGRGSARGESAPSAPAASTSASAAPPAVAGARRHSSSGRTAASRSSAAPRSRPASSPAAAGNSMPISIGTVRIENGSANYTDRWIQPNFAVGIQTLAGSIDGLSSDPRSRARVDLHGSVDRYAPVRIWGEANLLAAATYTDLKMNFNGVELSSITPYSGHFAGYKIDKGKLTVDLAYHIENRRLSAEHHIVVDQLQLGEKVNSPDAVNLPLKLAVALLKDRNGVIDLQLPVSGSLDDPQFRIGPIIWKVFVNLVEKAVTAPFALLGHLFGGGDQVNQIDFQPGSAQLDAAAQQRLSSIVKALTERPGLELDVPAVYSVQLDTPALAASQLQQQLQRRAQAADPKSTPESQLAQPSRHFRLLLAEYREQLGAGQPLPPLSAAIAATQKSKEAGADYPPAIAELEAVLLPRIQIGDTQLQNLATRRAHAVQDALLQGTRIDPARIFLINGPAAAADAKSVQLALALK